MKSEEKIEVRTCSRCGRQYQKHPALSRKDNVTLICPSCGVREALESIKAIEKCPHYADFGIVLMTVLLQ